MLTGHYTVKITLRDYTSLLFIKAYLKKLIIIHTIPLFLIMVFFSMQKALIIKRVFMDITTGYFQILC